MTSVRARPPRGGPARGPRRARFECSAARWRRQLGRSPAATVGTTAG